MYFLSLYLSLMNSLRRSLGGQRQMEPAVTSCKLSVSGHSRESGSVHFFPARLTYSTVREVFVRFLGQETGYI